MKYYELQLPHYTNAGVTTVDAMRAFETGLLNITGGFNRRTTSFGYWLDSRNGKRFEDLMTPYMIAATAEEMVRILDLAWKLFPDQEAIFYAEIGAAHIVHKPAYKVTAEEYARVIEPQIRNSMTQAAE